MKQGRRMDVVDARSLRGSLFCDSLALGSAPSVSLSLSQNRGAFNNLKKRPPPQPRVEITTVGDIYAYLEAEKMRYVRAKIATTSTSMGSECYI
ncbi:hypothetical protein TNCV_4115051 [Trichonephila clavipes]|nr:hypothetical protein TNCV_4115051 [Trichonephila clavipes]